MNSRERILAAINHKDPDKIPVDLGSTPSSGISAIAYSNLKAHLDIQKGRTRIYDVVQQLAQPEDNILDMFGIDVADAGRMFNSLETDWYDITLPNDKVAQYPKWFRPEQDKNQSWHVYSADGIEIALMPPNATFFSQTHFPYLDQYPDNYSHIEEDMAMELWSALAHSPWDNAHKKDFWDQLRVKTRQLRQQTDRAIIIVCGCNLFEWGTFLRRLDNFMMDLLADQQNVEKLLDELMIIHLNTLEKVCQAVGDVADIIRFGDDLGMDTGPFMSPDIYRKIFKPRHTQLCDYVKKHSDMYTFLHSCGSIYKLIPDFIEAGFEILNPVQTNCTQMDPATLKTEFGRDVTFWGGGVDTRHVLNRLSPNQVKEDVHRRLDIFAPGGGFVFNPIHNILPDVPPENIIAMFDAVKEFNG